MKARRGKFSGAIGNEIYVNTKQRQVVWSRPRRKPRPTADRQRARANLGGVAAHALRPAIRRLGDGGQEGGDAPLPVLLPFG